MSKGTPGFLSITSRKKSGKWREGEGEEWRDGEEDREFLPTKI